MTELRWKRSRPPLNFSASAHVPVLLGLGPLRTPAHSQQKNETVLGIPEPVQASHWIINPARESWTRIKGFRHGFSCTSVQDPCIRNTHKILCNPTPLSCVCQDTFLASRGLVLGLTDLKFGTKILRSKFFSLQGSVLCRGGVL
jgi:hypothetical protein